MIAKTIESCRSKSNKSSSGRLCTSLIFSFVLSMILTAPAWAQSFEALGRWNSTYGRMAIRYAGTKPDGTEAIVGKWLNDAKKREIGRITKGEYNRKTGKLWFDYSESWTSDKGRANFKLSPDKSKFVGTFKSVSGQTGDWVLNRPVAQSMIVYVPGKTQVVDFNDDDVFIKLIGNDKQLIVIPAGGKVVQVVGGGNKVVKVAAGGDGDNANGGAGNDGAMQSVDQGSTDVTLSIKNDSGGPVRANWVDTDGTEGKSEDIIKPGEDKELGMTHPGHVYRVREAKYNSLLKEFRVPKGKTTFKVVVPARQAG